MNSNRNTMAKAVIRREASIPSIPRELPAPSSTKLLAPNNPSAWITLFFQLAGFFILGVIFFGYIGSLGSLNRIKDKLRQVEKVLGPLAAQINEKESLKKIANQISPQEPSYAAAIKPSSPQPLNKMPDSIPIANQLVTQASPSVEVKTAALQPLEKISDPIIMANQLATQKASPIAESKTAPFKPPAGKPRHSKGNSSHQQFKTNKSIQTNQKLLVN